MLRNILKSPRTKNWRYRWTTDVQVVVPMQHYLYKTVHVAKIIQFQAWAGLRSSWPDVGRVLVLVLVLAIYLGIGRGAAQVPNIIITDLWLVKR